jgi:hypothetical protein
VFNFCEKKGSPHGADSFFILTGRHGHGFNEQPKLELNGYSESLLNAVTGRGFAASLLDNWQI